MKLFVIRVFDQDGEKQTAIIAAPDFSNACVVAGDFIDIHRMSKIYSIEEIKIGNERGIIYSTTWKR